MVLPSSKNPREKKKRKKTTLTESSKTTPDFLRTVGGLYPAKYLTKDGKLPRKYKGTYCSQLFSRVRFGEDVSQKLRTRTVTTGFWAAMTEDNRDAFQKKVDDAVDQLSRERVLASLFANFVFMDRLRNGTAPPEPDTRFFKSCLASCIKSKGGKLNADFDRFSSLTGLTRLEPPKKLNLDQQREHEAGCMATSTSVQNTTRKRGGSSSRDGFCVDCCPEER